MENGRWGREVRCASVEDGATRFVPVRREPVFGLDVPQHIPGGVPDDVLDPRRTWTDGSAYDAQAKRLAAMFRKNFEQFAERVHDAVREAGPTS